MLALVVSENRLHICSYHLDDVRASTKNLRPRDEL